MGWQSSWQWHRLQSGRCLVQSLVMEQDHLRSVMGISPAHKHVRHLKMSDPIQKDIVYLLINRSSFSIRSFNIANLINRGNYNEAFITSYKNRHFSYTELSNPIWHSSQSVIVTTGIICPHLKPRSILHLQQFHIVEPDWIATEMLALS